MNPGSIMVADILTTDILSPQFTNLRTLPCYSQRLSGSLDTIRPANYSTHSLLVPDRENRDVARVLTVVNPSNYL